MMAASSWIKQKELGGGVWQFRLLLLVFSLLGPTVMQIIVRPIAFVFYLAAGRQRVYSRDFLNTVRSFSRDDAPRQRRVLHHFQSFAVSLVDKMSAWAGKLDLGDLEYDQDGDYEDLVDTLRRGQGVLAMCSHLGNIEMLRALGSLQVSHIPNFRIIAIVEFSGTGKFNKIIEKINEDSMTSILPVSDIGPETILRLRDFSASGGMIVIAGDRTAPNNSEKVIEGDFLGRPARFPFGTYMLADLLKIPVYSLFAMRTDDTSLKSRYRFHVWKSAISLEGGRRERMDRINNLAAEFRAHLQDIAVKYPCQWFNFYPFWEIGPMDGQG